MFLDAAAGEFVPGTDTFVFSKPMRFFDARNERLWTIPAGFDTDFSSIPWPVWSIMRCSKTSPEVRRAGALHDFVRRKNCMIAKKAHQLWYDAVRTEVKRLGYVRAQACYMVLMLADK